MQERAKGDRLETTINGLRYRVCRSTFISPGTLVSLSDAQVQGRILCLERLSGSWYRVLKEIAFKRGEVLVFESVPKGWLATLEVIMPEKALDERGVKTSSPEQSGSQAQLFCSPAAEECLAVGLSTRQKIAWAILGEQGSLRMQQFAALCFDTSPRTLHRDLQKMIIKG